MSLQSLLDEVFGLLDEECAREERDDAILAELRAIRTAIEKLQPPPAAAPQPVQPYPWNPGVGASGTYVPVTTTVSGGGTFSGYSVPLSPTEQMQAKRFSGDNIYGNT